MNDLDSLYRMGGISSGAIRKMSNLEFDGVAIERILFGLGAPPDAPVLVDHCFFNKCVVQGEFRIAHGTIVSNVCFNDVRSADLMTISAMAVLDQVVVKGDRNCAGLWVKPPEAMAENVRENLKKWKERYDDSIDLMLDFSDFKGRQVEVLGLPLDKLKWNGEMHIPMVKAKFSKSIWKELRFPVNSFWFMRFKRLELFDVSEGVFSLPSNRIKNMLKQCRKCRF